MVKYKSGNRKRSRRKANTRTDTAANAHQNLVAQTAPKEETTVDPDTSKPKKTNKSNFQESADDTKPGLTKIRVVLWHRVVAALVVVGLLIWGMVRLFSSSDEETPPGPDPIMEELFDQDTK